MKLAFQEARQFFGPNTTIEEPCNETPFIYLSIWNNTMQNHTELFESTDAISARKLVKASVAIVLEWWLEWISWALA